MCVCVCACVYVYIYISHIQTNITKNKNLQSPGVLNIRGFKIRVFIDLFLSCAHDHSTEMCGFLIFIISFVHDHSTETRVFTDFFYLYMTIRQKYIVLSFVHEHSTKN